MTPLTAFAPHSVPPGPRTTSMRSMSAMTRSWPSQNTPPNTGEYTVRPSIMTSILLAVVMLNPRVLIG